MSQGPPYRITADILSRVAEIAEAVGRAEAGPLSQHGQQAPDLGGYMGAFLGGRTAARIACERNSRRRGYRGGSGAVGEVAPRPKSSASMSGQRRPRLA